MHDPSLQHITRTIPLHSSSSAGCPAAGSCACGPPPALQYLDVTYSGAPASCRLLFSCNLPVAYSITCDLFHNLHNDEADIVTSITCGITHPALQWCPVSRQVPAHSSTITTTDGTVTRISFVILLKALAVTLLSCCVCLGIFVVFSAHLVDSKHPGCVEALLDEGGEGGAGIGDQQEGQLEVLGHRELVLCVEICVG